jgi:hypothetical protein
MYWNGKCSYEKDIPQFERSRALISARALQTAALVNLGTVQNLKSSFRARV